MYGETMTRGAAQRARPAGDGEGGRLAYLLARVTRRLESELCGALREEGVSLEQFRVLETLTDGGPCSMGELAEAALVERPTLTKIVDRMVAAGLVFRRPDRTDRRRVTVVASDEGEALAGRLSGAARAQERRLIDGLGPRDAAVLRGLLLPLA